LNLNMQVKLLRAIEGGGYTPIGSSAVKHADIRIVAATNRNLRKSLEDGSFRKDFYFRIHILPITLPPLRSRKEDIPLIVNHFVSESTNGDNLSVMPQRILTAMQHYDWPGNVRELQNSVRRFITLGEIDFLNQAQSDTFAEVRMTPTEYQDEGLVQSLSDAIGTFEKRYILHLLNENKWHRTHVAKLLGIDRRTLFRKMKAFGL
jgi:transcriptional regulator with PAS, ATPase and Fis domain